MDEAGTGFAESGARAAARTIFVTGAASGIGLSTARMFAKRGWRIGAFDIDEAGLARLADELGEAASFTRVLDVTDRDDVLRAAEAFGAWSGGRLDLLFNNAGIIARGAFADMAWDQITRIVGINLLGGMSVIHAALPLLRATPGALCMSTSSASAIFGSAELAAYSATKHAVKGMTEALSLEFAAYGIRAADVLPGIIDTPMLPGEIRPFVPTEGHWRLMSPDAVAQAVWDAYAGTGLHHYLPPELQDVDIRITRDPEGARDLLVAGGLL